MVNLKQLQNNVHPHPNVKIKLNVTKRLLKVYVGIWFYIEVELLGGKFMQVI
jgi:hypothetical protein